MCIKNTLVVLYRIEVIREKISILKISWHILIIPVPPSPTRIGEFIFLVFSDIIPVVYAPLVSGRWYSTDTTRASRVKRIVLYCTGTTRAKKLLKDNLSAYRYSVFFSHFIINI